MSLSRNVFLIASRKATLSFPISLLTALVRFIMLHKRLATSALLISATLGLTYLDYRMPAGGIFLLPLLLFFSLGTAIDVTRLLKSGSYGVNRWASRVGVGVTVLIASVPLMWTLGGTAYPSNCPVGRLGWLAIAAVFALGIAIAWEMAVYRAGDHGATGRVMSAAFAITYIGIPMGMYVAIRSLGSPHWSLAALLSLVASTKIADAGAYFTGKLIGRHKLIPRLSPGKTIEGAIGGVLASIAMSFAMFQWTMPALTGNAANFPWWGPIVFGVLCSCVGMFGDLAESLMKRDSGAKDSGQLLPGLGGVWDVTDSLIATSIPGYLCFVCGAAGPIG